MGKNITAKCKHCGKVISYSNEAYELLAESGDSKPRRCKECSKGHGTRIKSLPTPYFSFGRKRKKCGDFGSHNQEFTFHGKRVHKEKTAKSDLSGMDISITDEDIIKLYSLLESNRVVLMVSATGSGKSTYVPMRLLFPPEDYNGDFVDRLKRQGQIVITQPRIVATSGTAIKTASMSGEKIGDRSVFGYRYSIKKDSYSEKWNWCITITDGTLPHWIREGKLGQYSLVMIDEAHERSCNIDFDLGALLVELHKYPQLRVIISSATINTSKFLQAFSEAGISCKLLEIKVEKKIKKFEHLWQNNEVLLSCDCWLCKKSVAKRKEFWEQKKSLIGQYDLAQVSANFALDILQETRQGSIIVFLHGEVAIKEAATRIRSRCQKDVVVIPIYRRNQESAKRILDETEGKRRVIVATNLAETSVTIPDLVYCINSGWIKQNIWNPVTQAENLVPKLHSKDGNSQRGGRVGRNQDGYVYHLFTKEQWDSMDDHTPPEITHSNLEDLAINIKSSGFSGLVKFPLLEKADEWTNMGLEMQRVSQSLLERGIVDEDGLVTEEALSLIKIPRLPSEASVLFKACEQGILFETATALAMMSERDGSIHTGANLYDSWIDDRGNCQGKGLLIWDCDWTAETKAKVSAIHQGLKIECRDDLDFAVKLAFCFQQAKSNGLSEEWANYHCINCENLNTIVTEIEKLITESLGDERDESLRQLDFGKLEKVRALFFAAWPDRIATLQSDGQIIFQTKTGKGIVSPNSAGCWDDGDKAILMALAEDEAIVANFPQRVSVASFVVCMPGSGGCENLLCDQAYPVGCWVKTRKNGNSFAIEFLKIPSSRVLHFKKDVWSDERPEESAAFHEAFRDLQLGSQSLDVKTSWIGNESEIARIVRWENKDGFPVAVLSSLFETEMQKSVGKKGDTVEVEIHCVARDPVGKNGWILGRTSNLEIPIELSNMSLSDVGWGLELIEGETLLLTVKGFEDSGLPQLSNIKKVMDDLKQIVKEISESEDEIKGKELPYVDYTGTVIGIMRDQERAAVAIQKENGVVHIFEPSQASIPGSDLKYLRIGEEVIVRLILFSDVIEIGLPEKITEDEINKMPSSWKRINGSKISIPICLEDKDIRNWNARMESKEYIQRRSWQYCLQVRISLKDRLSELVQGTVVKALVEKISQGKNGEFIGINVVLGDNIPCFIPANYVRSDGVYKGEMISVFIKDVDPETGFLQLNDDKNRKEWRIKKLQEQIKKVRINILETIEKRDDEDTSYKWKEIYTGWIADGVAQIAEKEQEIEEIQRSMEE